MIDSLYTALTAGGSSALSSLLTCYIMRHIFKRDEEQRRKTEEELSKAKDQQWKMMRHSIEELENALDQHISGDQTQVFLNELKRIGGNVQKLLDQQQALLVADGEQKQQIITLFNNLKEQKEELKECQKEHKK
jgi:phosphopantothenate synthetase